MQKFRLACEGHGANQPPDHLRNRIVEFFDPLPMWYQALEDEATEGGDFPLHAVTKRPMHMYHSWDSQNAWLRQITSHNYLYMNRVQAEAIGVGDLSWAWVESHNSRIRVQVKHMEAVEPNTVWTWNAIGKASGAWGLDKKANE
mgnify:CR=1 FL=1